MWDVCNSCLDIEGCAEYTILCCASATVYSGCFFPMLAIVSLYEMYMEDGCGCCGCCGRSGCGCGGEQYQNIPK